jgi:hypothetical protein
LVADETPYDPVIATSYCLTVAVCRVWAPNMEIVAEKVPVVNMVVVDPESSHQLAILTPVPDPLA